MKRATAVTAVLLFLSGALSAQSKIDTIYVSTRYTTHIVFSTDLTYGDMSNQTDLVGKIVEQNKNMMALKARQPFTTTASVSALESNGNIHTFIVAYDEHPSELIIDTRRRKEPDIVQSLDQSPQQTSGTKSKKGTLPSYSVRSANGTQNGSYVSNLRMSDAPLLEDVIKYPRQLYHLTAKYLKVEAAVENIFAYSDITYITVSLINNSGVSYETTDAVFVIESKNKAQRKVVMESNLYPRNRYGTLTAPAGGSCKCAYTLDKITLSKDQVIKVYIYETNGQRNLVMSLGPKDINLAKRP